MNGRIKGLKSRLYGGVKHHYHRLAGGDAYVSEFKSKKHEKLKNCRGALLPKKTLSEFACGRSVAVRSGIYPYPQCL